MPLQDSSHFLLHKSFTSASALAVSFALLADLSAYLNWDRVVLILWKIIPWRGLLIKFHHQKAFPMMGYATDEEVQ